MSSRPQNNAHASRRLTLGDGIQVFESDVVIVGAGCAGLSAALALPDHRVTVITKAALGSGGSTPWAQGGIAAAIGHDDSPALHTDDTLVAGAGLSLPEVVAVLTSEGPEQVERLTAFGAKFDRTPDGHFVLGREAAHSRRRILHANGDATGAEVMRTLTAAVRVADWIDVREQEFAADLVTLDGRVCGVVTTAADGEPCLHVASAVVLATGGIGQLYAHTTNPVEVTGDGLGMAVRAGVRVVDVEFVQFHPTALRNDSDPKPLLTEALRGEGAVLVNELGERFMLGAHPDAELAPRDVVARSIRAQEEAGHEVFLDARAAVGDSFPDRFPTVWQHCQSAGIDPRVEPMPVTPAVHYHMGGIDVDVDGRASCPGLWACGEAASTGVHGANRLASNSLLEGLVFGSRVARSIASSPLEVLTVRELMGLSFTRPPRRTTGSDTEEALRTELRTLMWRDAGLVRSARGLERAKLLLNQMSLQIPCGAGELHNMIDAARLVVTAALRRRESRGGHYRQDFPEPIPRLQHRNRFVVGGQPTTMLAFPRREPTENHGSREGEGVHFG